ncbi:MAG: efflux RND transporter permease subunit [Bacteroidaceae bacterium]|nr:efflux RND transporter permease subunit [Bacteroidaceae bacterium]
MQTRQTQHTPQPSSTTLQTAHHTDGGRRSVLSLFIDRPILAGVISVMIVIVGLIGLLQLPIEQFPDIAPPTVSVGASYTGANAETLQKAVVVPIEEAINGVENMLYMTSSASNNGSARINVFFKQGTDPDMATVNVQNRVAQAQGLLPAEVTRTGVTVTRRQTSTLKSLGLYSPNGTYDRAFLNNYFKINIEPRLSRVPGVGEVDVWGANYAMRIWLDPAKMAQHKLMPSDITAVLAEQNIESPAGTLGEESENTFQFVLKYRGRYEDEADYENLVVRSEPDGTILRLKDVARVEIGLQNYAIEGSINGRPGATCMISQTPGSNANEIIVAIDKLVEEIRADLPADLELIDLMSTKDFLDASMNSVERTLFEAIILVVLVVYLFLQRMRTTLIPLIAIIVSLVGTFGFLYVADFSLNTLTLFALVLVIGTVVDDAIVVAEAVQAQLDGSATDARQATVSAMSSITSALITSTLVFMAVFIPVCFMGGTSGIFYTQFGLTMAVAVLISMVNALTLSPALCALIMKRHTKADGERGSFSYRFHEAFETSFQALVAKYKYGAAFFLRRRWLVGVLIVASLGTFAYLLRTTKTALVPNEDMGVIYVTVQTQPGSSKAATRATMDEVERRIANLPQLKAYSKTNGVSRMAGQSSNNGMFLLRLKNWDERKGDADDLQSVMAEVTRRVADISEAKIMVFTQPMITGYGATNGFELQVQDHQGGSVDSLLLHTNRLIQALQQRPEISRAQTSFDNRYPQYRLEVDAARCKQAGVSPTDVLACLSGYIGGSYSSNMNKFSKLYRVMVQGEINTHLDAQSLQNMYVRTNTGHMAPLAGFVRLTPTLGTASLNRFNLFPAIQVSGLPEKGYSSGQALQAVREEAARLLPEGYGYEFAGMSREEATAGQNTLYVFLACIIFIYLILCALYESLFIPWAIILSVPFGLMGSFLFAQWFGLENNIYMQTGVIMLIGLLSKTAILLTEYATTRRRAGMSISMAALSAAKVRLRPILMTSLTMIFGLLPMMFATGAGANGNRSLGVGTVGGMLVGTLALLFMVPALFAVFQWLEERLLPNRRIHPSAV